MTKLLNRPLRAFALYSFIVLVISIPVYFYVVDLIWRSELDEHNQLIRDRIAGRLDDQSIEAGELARLLDWWNTLQPGTTLRPAGQWPARRDSIYEITKVAAYTDDDEADRFRGLQSHLRINGRPYRLTVETNVEEADETLLAIALVTGVFMVVLFLGFLLLNRRIAARSWQPFYGTLAALRSFDLARGEGLRLAKPDIQEFRELNVAIERLIERNVTAYRQQQAFVENASHELQTPIALLQSKIDLLLQESERTPGLSALLDSIQTPLSRLSRINKNLLLLAKVEHRQFEEVRELDLGQYVRNALALFEDYLADKQLQVSNSLDEKVVVTAHPFLLETLLHNLLSNAIRHSPAAGQLALTLRERTLLVRNSGARPLEADQLFERFARASQEKVGSGLGLAIVKGIADRYGWSVSYRFTDQAHHFLVTF